MGAYYNAINTTNEVSLNPHDIDGGQGLKLMEHAYIGNGYVQFVMDALEGGNSHDGVPDWKNKVVVWVCDYNDDHYKDDYENATDHPIMDKVQKRYDAVLTDATQIIVNHHLKEYVDMFAVIYKHREIGNITKAGSWLIHPLPILVNSETERMGGGDWDEDTPMRNRWAGHRIEVVRKKPEGYKNISYDCVWKEK